MRVPEYELAWREENGTRRKVFASDDARTRFIDKLTDKPYFIEVIGYRDPEPGEVERFDEVVRRNERDHHRQHDY